MCLGHSIRPGRDTKSFFASYYVKVKHYFEWLIYAGCWIVISKGYWNIPEWRWSRGDVWLFKIKVFRIGHFMAVVFNLFWSGTLRLHSSSSRSPCSHICTREFQTLLSIIALVQLLAEPRDCTGGTPRLHWRNPGWKPLLYEMAHISFVEARTFVIRCRMLSICFLATMW